VSGATTSAHALMRPSAAEALKAAIRRSLPLAAILVVLGIVAVNAVKQLQGPQYAAEARVFHSTTDIGSILTDIQPTFIDPERVIETALSLAESPEVYERAAEKLPDDRTAEELQDATTVAADADSDVIAFTTTLDDETDSVAAVNTIATEYIAWRSEIFAKDIQEAVARIQARLRSGNAPQAGLREQLTRLQTLEALHSGGAVLVEEATSAPKVSPRPVRDTLLGASFGLVVALLISGLREAFNTRIRSEADVEDSLRRPVLATIESLPKRAGLVTVGRHESRYGDTYALLAANVMQLRGKSETPTILAVTSSIAGEGKTTTASNLAVAMAQRGQRVVLADFDLRKPSVGRMFRIPAGSPGVVQLVDGASSLDGAVWTVPLNGASPTEFHPKPMLADGNGSSPAAAQDGHGSLRVVASGGNERGARVARSPQLPRLLEELGKDADVVILDTPPALATVEMAELSRSVVDAVIVVVRHGRVTRRSLHSLQRQAEGWQSEILGAVLVDAPPEEDDYYYYKG
jgi:polysaccharide biosynthesis transport protein